MFPDRLTTHAGVSGVASSRAITASTPILLAWITTVKKHACGKAGTLLCLFTLLTWKNTLFIIYTGKRLYYQDSIKGRRGSSSLDMAQDGGACVKAQLFWYQLDKECDFMSSLPLIKSLYMLVYWSYSALTDLFDLFTCDRFTIAVHCSFCNNDNIQTGATASLLRGTEKTINTFSF